jgi:glycosyltransferase involved in cell wall biosynthesis
MKKFHIIIPSYNNSKWLEKNLSSALGQKHLDFRITYMDDCSSDDTYDKAQKLIEAYGVKDRVTLLKNAERCGAMENIFNAVHNSKDEEIIITLDGDDWLAHSKVLSYLDQVYSDPGVWMTYGQYRSWPDNAIGCCQQIPANIISSNGFRQFRWCSSHLRTFYAHLFKKIKREDFLNSEGKFYAMGWDLPIMFGLLEMAGTHSKFIKEILYIYNVSNPINDSKVNLQLQQSVEKIVRGKEKYKPL